MSDSKYFQTTKKGEIHELKEELSNPNKDKKKEAVKKVIAAMTVGKDVSVLFADVVNCMQTPNIELKKLVYLYLINYAKSQPDLAILAVNTFVKDSQDANPLIRALAVRTMGCIRVEKITEYLCEPLRKCLKDEDPYVRKTAAVCVAKLYDINPELVADQGFLDSLTELLSDSNPMVVANSVAALAEIQETAKSSDVFKITASTLQKLLAALNECTEWGQVFILDSLATYSPHDAREADNIIERVVPRLQHANSAVVLSAVKVILKFMEKVSNAETVKALCKKLAPPLVTLLSGEPEIQYVALRNINLIAQKRPAILHHETKVFFCKYNDPIYVKMEKLEIMVMLAADRNIDQVLAEFKEYATEVDVDFVRKAVRAIGRCAIKLDKAAERCITVLLELIQTKVNYVLQEAIVVIKDIFRKYPNRYESIIGTLCENLDTLDEPEAKASMIWIIGEYAERIDNADELLESFLDGYSDENSQVQLQLLTAVVKLFLKRPGTTQAMVQKVLALGTQDSDNPDLRDRGYVYWRLLSTNPEAAKAVVLAERPTITDDSSQLEPALLETLLDNIATLASVYHKPPETFVCTTRMGFDDGVKADDEDDEDEPTSSAAAASGSASGSAQQSASLAAPSGTVGSVSDLLGDLGLGGAPAARSAPQADLLGDLLGGGVSAKPAAAAKPVLLPAQRGKGLTISGCFARRGGQITHDLTFENQSGAPVANFAVQFNKNSFGFAPAAPLQVAEPLHNGQTASASLPISTSGPVADGVPSLIVQIAVRTSIEVFYFQDTIPLSVVLGENGRLEKPEFLGLWKSIADTNEQTSQLGTFSDVDAVIKRLEQKNVFFIARRAVENQAVVYLSSRTITGAVMLLELTFVPNGPTKCCVKSENIGQANLLAQSIEGMMR